jgi:23S rRNA pseudouridine1911/1915/1917 synthase
MAVIKTPPNSEDSEQNAGGKQAITHYRIEKRFEHFTELSVQLETGRTHQIRVHMAHIRHPIVGDGTYNPRYKRPAGISDSLDENLKRFHRQALHATQLSFIHPATKEQQTFNCEPPADYLELLNALKEISL